MDHHLPNLLTMWVNFAAVGFGDGQQALLLAFDFYNHSVLGVQVNVMEVELNFPGENNQHMLLMSIGWIVWGLHHDPQKPIMNQEMIKNVGHLLENVRLLQP